MITKKLILPVVALLFFFAGCQQPEVHHEETALVDPVNIAVLVGEGFHDGEAYMPMGYLSNRGAVMTVIGPERGEVTAYNSDFTINIQQAVTEVSINDFDALILPGGEAPAMLRENEEVVSFVRDFFETGKVVAAICHGPQVLARAGVLEGVTCTAVGGIQDELEEAGANFVDESVVVYENLITSRTPPDLYDFSRAIEHEVLAAPEMGDIPAQPGS